MRLEVMIGKPGDIVRYTDKNDYWSRGEKVAFNISAEQTPIRNRDSLHLYIVPEVVRKDGTLEDRMYYHKQFRMQFSEEQKQDAIACVIDSLQYLKNIAGYRPHVYFMGKPVDKTGAIKDIKPQKKYAVMLQGDIQKGMEALLYMHGLSVPFIADMIFMCIEEDLERLREKRVNFMELELHGQSKKEIKAHFRVSKRERAA